MLLHDAGTRHLHTTRTQDLAHAARDARPRLSIRLAAAAALASLARRLAPELPDPPVLRTRASPN